MAGDDNYTSSTGSLTLTDWAAPTSFTFQGIGGQMLFSIGPDGTITRGPAFTTDDEMSLVFWQKIAEAFPRFLRDNP